EQYTRLERSKVMARVDDKPVWAVVCFFVDREARGDGVATKLLRAAAAHAARNGATLIEGYPHDTKGKRTSDAFVWFGLASVFRRAGFREVARRSATRPIMRRSLRPPRASRRDG